MTYNVSSGMLNTTIPYVSTYGAAMQYEQLARTKKMQFLWPIGLSRSLRSHTAVGHFTCWISISLRPKTETKRLNFGLSPELRLTSHCGAHHCSLHNVIADVIADIFVFLRSFMNWRKSEVIFAHQNLISNWLTYVSCACKINRWVN